MTKLAFHLITFNFFIITFSDHLVLMGSIETFVMRLELYRCFADVNSKGNPLKVCKLLCNVPRDGNIELPQELNEFIIDNVDGRM